MVQKKFALCTVLLGFMTLVFLPSCDKKMESLDNDPVCSITEDTEPLSENYFLEEVSIDELESHIVTLRSSETEGPYLAKTPYYQHYIFNDSKRCGPASYCVVRRALRRGFDVSDEIIKGYPTSVGLDMIQGYATTDGLNSELIPRPRFQTEVTLGHDGKLRPDISKPENKKRRERFATFVKDHLVKKHVLLIPATFKFVLQPRNKEKGVFGHYYIIVGWHKIDGKVYYYLKDVMKEHKLFKISEEYFLDTVWYNNVKIPNLPTDHDNYTHKRYTHSSYEALALW